MEYHEALKYIDESKSLGSKPGLQQIQALLEKLGNPQESLKIIHITGTNGKGSTASFISKVLAEAGYKVGQYTSPYIETINDMLKISGDTISNEEFADCADQIKKAAATIELAPTEFEITTAMAFTYFSMKQVDFAVIEVGLGGSLDATNVMERSLISVITPIALDHTQFLGNSLNEIAAIKAGIIKNDSITVIHPQEDEVMGEIISKCNEKNNRLVVAPVSMVENPEMNEFGSEFVINNTKYKISLIGEHQIRNAIVAITVINVLKESYDISIEDEALYNGLAKTAWPGRMEIVGRRPTVILDGAHNLHGAKSLNESLKMIFPGRKKIAVLGILQDKDYRGILDATLHELDEIIVTEPISERKLSADQLAEEIRSLGKVPIVEPSIKGAIEKALSIAGTEDVVIFFGSLYLVGEARKMLRVIIN